MEGTGGLMSSSERFCQNLINLRRKSGLSQDDFAASCGMLAAYYGKLERMERSPTLRTAEKICANLGVPLAQMVGGEVDAPGHSQQDLLILGLLERLDPEDKAMIVEIIKLYARRRSSRAPLTP